MLFRLDDAKLGQVDLATGAGVVLLDRSNLGDERSLLGQRGRFDDRDKVHAVRGAFRGERGLRRRFEGLAHLGFQLFAKFVLDGLRAG